MKTPKKTLFASLACGLLLVPALALAQPFGPPGQRGDGPGKPHPIERLFDRLEVSDEQREQLDRIVDAQRLEMRSLGERMRYARESAPIKGRR